MSKPFHEELFELNDEILKMGTLVEEQIALSITALKNRDIAVAREVIERDSLIDAMELVIDEKCLDLIARHQPMAVDLRFILTGMRLNGELERVADQAVNVAERVIEIAGQPLLKPLVDIPKLALVSQKMVRTAIDSFITRDSSLARSVILMDSEADDLKSGIQNELINSYLVKDGTVAPRAVPLILVARHLERVCDHCTYIAEDVIYMVKAEVVKHHPERL
ncbi:MAG: phosphate signaling complex protein PhoU [Candidatus Omnitrophica bacterium]|nr:phosphate signaling complex protein PhoU [Candidatus Omnitrophota bacterium]